MLLVSLRRIELLVDHKLPGLQLGLDGLGGEFLSQTEGEEDQEERSV